MLIVWAGRLSTHQNLPTTEYKNEHSREDQRPSTRAAESINRPMLVRVWCWAEATTTLGFFPPVNLCVATVPLIGYATCQNNRGSSATVSGNGAERPDDSPDKSESLWTNLLWSVKDRAQAGLLK